jgi:hypothetical protein
MQDQKLKSTGTKKKIKPREAEIQSQGHKTLMYGTRVHAGPELKSTGIKKNIKPREAENPVPRTQNPNVWNTSACRTRS